MNTFDPRPVILEGTHVTLEPLATSHLGNLLEVGAEDEIWRYGTNPPFRTEADVQAWFRAAQQEVDAGVQLAFAIVHCVNCRAVGSTRYGDIRREHRGLEIGWTWIGNGYRRTAVNTECKYLLLRHAFEQLGAFRVQFKTDIRNERSQRAIERIGAVREGVLRRHLILHDGYVRDSVVYSVIDADWPAVKVRLKDMLKRARIG